MDLLQVSLLISKQMGGGEKEEEGKGKEKERGRRARLEALISLFFSLFSPSHSLTDQERDLKQVQAAESFLRPRDNAKNLQISSNIFKIFKSSKNI